MIGIERRAQRDITTFIFIDPIRYVGLEHYRAQPDEVARTIREMLPNSWAVTAGAGIWTECNPPHGQLLDEGFKIHLSATCDSAIAVLRAAVPILVRHCVVFKHLADIRVLDFMNSQSTERTACGKFITIYPNSIAQFKLLLEELHAATREYAGPYILSDKRYSQSKVLFYRYGAFRHINRLNVFGEREACLHGENGDLIRDQRQAYFILPEHVQDPFEEKPDESDNDLLNRRYRVTSTLQASSKGGVYLAEDTATGREVVLKEARPWINLSRDNPHDAVACLHHEHDVLKFLANSGYTPAPIEMFCEWEHWFLALEKAEGVTLLSYRAAEKFSILLHTDYTEVELRQYCTKLLDIAEQLLAGVRAIHTRGVVIRDLAPRNVIIDLDRGTVKFVDLESGYFVNGEADSMKIPIGTLGYSRMGDRKDRIPQFEDDYFALSQLIFDLVTPISMLFSLAPELRRPFLEHIGHEKGIPLELREFILQLPEHSECAEDLLLAARSACAKARVPATPAPLSTPTTLDRATDDIVAYIKAQLNSADDSGLLPTDYRRYASNRLSVAYGYCGIAQFLHKVGSEIPLVLQQEILHKCSKMTTKDYPPGLYIGSSGIAWVMKNLGFDAEAKRIMELTASSSLLNDNADLFYGDAGWGLANLFFFHHTKDEEYLIQALKAADSIAKRLQVSADGLFYENVDNFVYSGFGHGSAGIALFFLRLYEVTRSDSHVDQSRRLLDYEITTATERDGHMVWPRSNKDLLIYTPYDRIGSAGIAAVLLRFEALTGEGRFLEVAKMASRYLTGKFTLFPGQLSGMAGIGELFTDLYQHTGEQQYRDEAFRFADRILLHGIKGPKGLVFPGDELIRVATDFGTGSAGIGMFFHRLAAGGPRFFYDF